MIPEPLPQVGAMLCLDTELLPPGDCNDGSKYWKLAGSCVLVAPQLVLTIGHILGEREQQTGLERYRVFLPYQGLLETDGTPPLWEFQETKGDNLALVRLKAPVKEWAPLPPRKVKSLYKHEGSALVYGYGSWPTSDQGRREGIQQQHLVRLGRLPKDHPDWWKYDRLDLSWSASQNHGLIPGRGNSGGPMLKLEEESPAVSVVGIIREAGKDQQAGSWIGRDRWHKWLKEQVDQVQTQPSHLGQEYRLLTIDGTAQSIRFPVPDGATRVRATLNASQGMRLEMDIVPVGQQSGSSNRPSGRFLHCTLNLEAGTKEIEIGVGPVARAPQNATEVLAQLCVLFL